MTRENGVNDKTMVSFFPSPRFHHLHRNKLFCILETNLPKLQIKQELNKRLVCYHNYFNIARDVAVSLRKTSGRILYLNFLYMQL